MTRPLLGYGNPRLRLDPGADALVRRHRVGHVELRVDDIARDGPLHDAGLRRTIRDFAEAHRLTLSVHAFAGVNLAEKIDRLRALCIDLHREQVDFAAAIGARWLTLHLGTCGFAGDPARKHHRLALAHAALTALAGATSGSGVDLALENVPRLPAGAGKCYLGDCPDELATMLAYRDGRFGAVFDVGHVAIAGDGAEVGGGGSDGGAFLDAMGARLRGVHVHANDGISDSHSSLSAAAIAARPALFGRLLDIGRSGIPLIVEHHAIADAAVSLRALERLGDSR